MLIAIIENTQKNRDELSNYGWGHEDVELTQDQVLALLNGKCLALFDGEHTHCFYVKTDDSLHESLLGISGPPEDE